MKNNVRKTGPLFSILVAVVIASVGNFSANAADKNSNSVNWDSFNLSKQQIKTIQTMDVKWQKISNGITAQILKDQQKLRVLLKNPNTKDAELRNLQKQIILHQDKLKFAALEMFLNKRRVLTPAQRKKLHKVISG